jgi:CHASE3 domain sensor protein
MDKASSIIAALNAGKLPSTQQFDQFVAHLEQAGIVRLKEGVKHAVAGAQQELGEGEEEVEEAVEEAGQALSRQGKVLADDLREVVRAFRTLLNDKNGLCFLVGLRLF